jgi:hypothetical protein
MTLHWQSNKGMSEQGERGGEMKIEKMRMGEGCYCI